jgi:hypothetical protein
MAMDKSPVFFDKCPIKTSKLRDLMYANYSPSANQLRGSENPPVGFSSHGAVTNLVAG